MTTMRAVLPFVAGRSTAGQSVTLGDLPVPEPAAGEVLVRVRATALNRADLLQMRGLYPPPPGESEIPGLECAGEIVALDSESGPWSVGDRVMALLAGGGHAECVVVPVGQLMPIPEGLSFEDAAALPEVAITAWTNLVVEGRLKAGESVLITGATSGVGTFATQLALALGATVIACGRSLERLERLRDLGAEHLVTLEDGMERSVRDATGGRGVDLVLDLVGGTWMRAFLASLAPRGRLVLVGVLAGRRVELDLFDVLRRRLSIKGSVLRSRSRDEKRDLVAGFWDFASDRLDNGTLRPVVDRVVPFADIADAYTAMAEGGHLGKIVTRA